MDSLLCLTLEKPENLNNLIFKQPQLTVRSGFYIATAANDHKTESIRVFDSRRQLLYWGLDSQNHKILIFLFDTFFLLDTVALLWLLLKRNPYKTSIWQRNSKSQKMLAKTEPGFLCDLLLFRFDVWKAPFRLEARLPSNRLNIMLDAARQ